MRLANPDEIGREECTNCHSCMTAQTYTDEKLPWAKFCSQGCLNDFKRRLG